MCVMVSIDGDVYGNTVTARYVPGKVDMLTSCENSR
jgi:hypothetical protein